MYTKFKKLFISLIFLKNFLLPAYSMSSESCSTSTSSSTTASVPVPDQGVTEDPRMHVTPESLGINDDHWLVHPTTKIIVDTQSRYTEKNTISIHMGFLIANAEGSSDFIFPDILLNDPNICFGVLYRNEEKLTLATGNHLLVRV